MEIQISVLTIGNELLDGDIVDSNTLRIADLLSPHGFVIYQRISVGDEVKAIGEALLYLGRMSRFVIVSGGLGPTLDDMTAEAAALAFQRPLVKNGRALDVIRRFFKRIGQDMTPRQEKQAMLPEGAVILDNDQGSAPGFMLESGGCRFVFLPGVPREMASMIQSAVLPFLQKSYAEAIPWRQKTFKLLGVPESRAESLLDTLGLPKIFQIAFCVKLPFVHVKLGLREKDGDQLLRQASAAVRTLYGETLVAEDGETLPENVANLLIRNGKTLSLAESCSGGWIAKMLTDIPGSSVFLERGAVSYSNRSKNHWLNVSEKILQGSGAVSKECALAMARGMRKTANTDLALAVTGIAGPDGGTPDKPVGTVFIALAGRKQEKIEQHLFWGDRDTVRLRTVCSALDLLRRHLLEQA